MVTRDSYIHNHIHTCSGAAKGEGLLRELAKASFISLRCCNGRVDRVDAETLYAAPDRDARCVPIPFGCSLHSIALHYFETTDIRRLVLSITVLP